jgi:hypothetical protein
VLENDSKAQFFLAIQDKSHCRVWKESDCWAPGIAPRRLDSSQWS